MTKIEFEKLKKYSSVLVKAGHCDSRFGVVVEDYRKINTDFHCAECHLVVLFSDGSSIVLSEKDCEMVNSA